MNLYQKTNYFYKKIPEMKNNVEPLTHLMIRTTGESMYKNKTFSKKINTSSIHLLHSIDRTQALDKLDQRISFLKKHKNDILELEKKHGFVDLASDLFANSPFQSINAETIAQISTQYVTISGVGRIAALKIVFPKGIRIQVNVCEVDWCLKKRLISIHSYYLYSHRFFNLKKYGLEEKEIQLPIKKKTCKNRNPFLKTRKQFIPWL
jgi:hypothetical protein